MLSVLLGFSGGGTLLTHGVCVLFVLKAPGGRRMKGNVGRSPTVRVDVRGVLERVSGDIWLEVFDKVVSGPLHARRVGPPNAGEAAATFAHCAPGSVVYTDSAAAYSAAAAARGCEHHTVNHHVGQFARQAIVQGRPVSVSTQGIDGTWGLLREFLRRHGCPTADLLAAHVDEFVWRRNLHGRDPFLALLQAISDGCWQ